MVVRGVNTINEMLQELEVSGTYILEKGKKLTTTEIHSVDPDGTEFVDTIYVLWDPEDNTMWNLRTRQTGELRFMDLFEMSKDTWHRPLKYSV